MQNTRNPYSTGVAPEPNLAMDTDNQMRKYKEEERTQKAAPQLAYPLQTMLDFISNTLTVMMQMRTALNTSTSNPDVDKRVVQRLEDKIDKMNILALSMVDELEKLTL